MVVFWSCDDFACMDWNPASSNLSCSSIMSEKLVQNYTHMVYIGDIEERKLEAF